LKKLKQQSLFGGAFLGLISERWPIGSLGVFVFSLIQPMKKTHLNHPNDRYLATDFIGQAIIFWRGVRRMTQKQLAEASAVCDSAVKRLEAGRKRGGWVLTLEQLCQGLCIKLVEMIAVAQRLAEEAREREAQKTQAPPRPSRES
jgi:DNA-binding Xre family transcriptional regulator